MRILLCGLLLASLSARAQCRDPWLNQLYKQLYSRAPVGQGESCECNVKLYNGGSWSSYQELTGYVQQLQQSGLRFGYAPLGANSVMVVAQGTQAMAVSLLDKGGNVIAAGGANVVAAGGANVIAAGGANVVAAGGANLTGLCSSTPGFAFGSTYGVLAAGQRRTNTSGKGALVIR